MQAHPGGSGPPLLRCLRLLRFFCAVICLRDWRRFHLCRWTPPPPTCPCTPPCELAHCAESYEQRVSARGRVLSTRHRSIGKLPVKSLTRWLAWVRNQKWEVEEAKMQRTLGFLSALLCASFRFGLSPPPLAQRPVDTTLLLLDAHVAQEPRCRLLKPYTVKAAAPTVSGTWKWPPK